MTASYRSRLLIHLASILLAVVVMMLSLSTPAPRVRSQIIERHATPGVDYRFHFVWKFSAETAERVVERLLDDESRGEATIDIPTPLIPSRLWLARKINSTYESARSWHAQREHRRKLHQEACGSMESWPLADVGLSRNGKPVSLPPGLALRVWENLRERDAWKWGYFTMTPPAMSTGTFDEGALLDHFGLGVDVEGDRETLILPPFLILLNQGEVIAILGGDGRFDQIPPAYDYLRAPQVVSP